MSHRFCWVDLSSHNPELARSFYGSLFQWSTRPTRGAMEREYSQLLCENQPVGGLFPMPEEMRVRGMRPHWTSYVRVEDVEATAERAQALGGVVVCVMDVGSGGCMSIIKDCHGASFSLWEGDRQRDAERRGAIGSSCWQELLTIDLREAQDYYRGLFGWTAEAGALGLVLKQGEEPVAGMLPMPASVTETRSQWNPYFAVASCAQAAARTRELGGQVVGGPFALPGSGDCAAVLLDTEGALFCVRGGP